MIAELYWRKYKLFPYEKEFGLREVQTLLKPQSVVIHGDKLEVQTKSNVKSIKELVYFSHFFIVDQHIKTTQAKLENGDTEGKSKRQNTRYSVHGLHEYKGKFNPQTVKALLNIYNVKEGQLILDPFCGSGTTLVEAAHHNISGYGTDINPLAVFISNTKIGALSVSKKVFNKSLDKYWVLYKDAIVNFQPQKDERYTYLEKWFDKDILKQIECLRIASQSLKKEVANIILMAVSNNLRDYSQQEPSDLRIRRRFSPMPVTPLIEKIKLTLNSIGENLEALHKVINPIKSNNKSINVEIQKALTKKEFKKSSFDFAITSPPYATALPYIDTQRLSIIWLNLIPPSDLKSLESALIGSREFYKKLELNKWQEDLLTNRGNLPKETYDLCISLFNLLKETDGFRKKAVPALLYRYFTNMEIAFEQVRSLLKKGKYFCLIVGHNHTNLGDHRTEIDTPKHLCYLANKVGFTVHENTELDAYQRYGIHSTNAVQRESLLVFKK